MNIQAINELPRETIKSALYAIVTLAFCLGLFLGIFLVGNARSKSLSDIAHALIAIGGLLVFLALIYFARKLLSRL